MSSAPIASMPQTFTPHPKHTHNHISSTHFCNTCSGPLKLGFPTQHHPLGRVACTLCQSPACNDCAFSTPIVAKTGSDSSNSSMQAPTAATAPTYAFICHNCGWSASIATETSSKSVRVLRKLMNTVQLHKPKSSVEDAVDFGEQECSICSHACCGECVKLKRVGSSTPATTNATASTLCFTGKDGHANESADDAQVEWKQIHTLSALPSAPVDHANRPILHVPAPSASAQQLVRKSSLRKPRTQYESDYPYTPAHSRKQSVEVRPVKHVRFVTDDGILAKNLSFAYSDVAAMREPSFDLDRKVARGKSTDFICQAQGCDGKCNTITTTSTTISTSTSASATTSRLTHHNTTLIISPLTATFTNTSKPAKLFPVSPLPVTPHTTTVTLAPATLPARAATTTSTPKAMTRPALHRSNASASSFGSERRHRRNASSLVTSTSIATTTEFSTTTLQPLSTSDTNTRQLSLSQQKRTTTLIAEAATQALAAKIAVARAGELRERSELKERSELRDGKGKGKGEGKPRVDLTGVEGEGQGFAFGFEREMRTRGWGRLGVAGWEWEE